MSWNYKREENNFETRVPEGDHRVRIKAADKAVSKKGNDMLVLQLEISGYTDVIYHYIVFMEDRPEITNRNLTQFFDSFSGIPEGDTNLAGWIGKVGAANIIHDEYNGNVNCKVKYFISAAKQDSLPAWKDVEGSSSAASDDDWMQVPEDGDLPF